MFPVIRKLFCYCNSRCFRLSGNCSSLLVLDSSLRISGNLMPGYSCDHPNLKFEATANNEFTSKSNTKLENGYVDRYYHWRTAFSEIWTCRRRASSSRWTLGLTTLTIAGRVWEAAYFNYRVPRKLYRVAWYVEFINLPITFYFSNIISTPKVLYLFHGK